MRKYKYESDDGITYEFTYSDETQSSVTFGNDGKVTYTRGGKKTAFSIDKCQSYIETDVHGKSVVFTEDDTDIVTLAVMVGEKRLEYNNDHTETRSREEYNDSIADSENVEDNFLRKMDREALLQAISKLKPTEQYIIHRLYLDAVTVSQVELAKELNLKEETMRKKSERLKEKLKKILIK